ncbi:MULTISPECIES: hypothetical protein [unclassified Nocardioides]|uniref:hypothetical protein n=1 Tax=unclassified Nocardioides TaxID=2615069 RepID=UPI0006FB57E8|nr:MULTISPECIES: hypothetical protein [unclassified Nocardioides]KQY64586.1 hypothetical protein ASD30_06635 [Nocardioides sp. Root140]KRF20781.1 hypothetical protein ASH02_00220 [Nocardioides sp. Soil796]
MNASRIIRRSVITGAGVVAAVALGTTSASAHHCYIPMYSLNGPTSANWLVINAEEGAAMFGIFTPSCDEQVDAGYAALREAGLPVAIKLMETRTIGDPKDEGKMNPNGANGKGLEYFGAGSTLADEMLGVWAGAAMNTVCPA